MHQRPAVAFAGLASAWLSLLASGAVACAPAPAPPSESAASVPAGSEGLPRAEPVDHWVTANEPDLRALTVVVHSGPPEALRQAYLTWSKRYRSLESVFAEAAEDGFGSGFVMVRSVGATTKAYVVTNQHVVGLAEDVWVQLGRDDTPIRAFVSRVDDVHDLALLEFLPADEPRELQSGFALASARAKDQDAVAASGYPGLGSRPSYQVSRGYVSNESFRFEEDEEESAATPAYYLQHTAPIDPGSSGGPLLDERGRVVGVNTMVARGRANVGLAIPSEYVSALLEAALRAPSRERRRADGEAPLAACQALLAGLEGADDSELAERQIGAGFIATEGLSSLSALPRDDEISWPLRFVREPTEVLLYASLLRLRSALASAPSPPTCVSSGDASFRIGGSERHVLHFAFEQDRFKLSVVQLPKQTGTSFLDGLTPKAVKKWKPSMR